MNEIEEIKELVLARLKTLPEDTGLSIGSAGDFSRDQMIERVEAGDEIGKKIIEIEMDFLRGLKDGILYESDTLTASH